VDPGSDLSSACSTPYGNQRKITLDLPDTYSQELPVLNALRQSEENHPVARVPT